PGKLIQGQTAPEHTYATGKMKKGQVLRIIDVEGEQVADFVSLKLDQPAEYLDCVYTNWMLGRYRWHKGDVIYTNHMNPMWTIIEDTVDDHYTGGGFCSRDARVKFGVDDQKGCRDTIQDAFAANGIDPNLLQSVSCFNIFMNVAYAPDGSWQIGLPKSKKGDHIDLRAEMDLFFASSVCFWPHIVNGEKPTPLRFEVYEGEMGLSAADKNPLGGRKA
ncbi:MAG: DUF1989 domain-containing protein, partial [Candidatus Binataceae bacterium]